MKNNKNNNMKMCSVFLAFCGLLFSCTAHSISLDSTLESWKYEKLTLPFDFAPNIDYQGVKEHKLSPGMYQLKAKDYFSYLLLFKIKSKTLLIKSELKTLLERYNKGLFAQAARDNALHLIDKIKITSVQGYKNNYHATLNFYDCINQCQQLTIIIELEQKLINGDLLIMASASAQPQSSDVWDTMRRTWYEMK